MTCRDGAQFCREIRLLDQKSAAPPTTVATPGTLLEVETPSDSCAVATVRLVPHSSQSHDSASAVDAHVHVNFSFRGWSYGSGSFNNLHPELRRAVPPGSGNLDSGILAQDRHFSRRHLLYAARHGSAGHWCVSWLVFHSSKRRR